MFGQGITIRGAGSLFKGEELTCHADELAALETRQALQYAMRGQNDESGRVHVDKGHHHALISGIRIRRAAGFPASLVAISQGGLIAMVPVGNHQFLVGHHRGDGGNHRRVGEPPYPVQDSVFVGDFHVGDSAGLQQLLDAGKSNAGRGGYLQYTGVEFDSTQKKWMIDGKSVDPPSKYTVAVSDFLFSGSELGIEFFNKNNPGVVSVTAPDNSDPKDSRNDMRLAVIRYLGGQ